MRIVVLIKPGAKLEESDACALEQALRVARRRIGVSVGVLTAGPAACRPALHAALALGADHGLHVADEELAVTDALALSRVFAAAVRRLGFDVLVCGARSDAPNLAAVPVMLAERLAIPALCHADELRLRPGRGRAAADEVIACCDEDDAIVERAAETPALVSVTDRAAAPRYPPFPAVAEARRKLIRTWIPAELGVCAAGIHRSTAATVVGGVVPGVRRRATMVTAGGDPRAAAVRLADFLAEHRFI
jgi:electron transfer flavoprotein beta subunit